MNVSIVGAYNTQFGAFVEKNRETGEIKDTKSFYELIIEAGQGAIKDAGLEAKDIDAVWIGSCSPSQFVNQEHVAPLGVEVDPEGLLMKPMTRTEAACASSSVALYDASYAVASGRFKNVLVIGAEKMNLLDTKGVTHTLACSSYWPEEGGQGMTFPGLFAELAKAYMKQYNFSEPQLREMFAHVAAMCYRNGIQNPLAHFGPGSLIEKKGLTTAEAILAMPDEGKGANLCIAPPLRLHDCSLVTDGAAAMVITNSDNAKANFDRAVELSGIGHASMRLALSKREKPWTLEGGKKAVNDAFAEAGVSIKDIEFAEVHDCFTINQLLTTEALGLSEDGRAGFDYMAGRFGPDDDCPVNLSGGLKAKGHPVGATGASMHALAFKQLVGEPIGVARGKGTPEIGVTFNVGGSAVTNCVSVLKRIK